MSAHPQHSIYLQSKLPSAAGRHYFRFLEKPLNYSLVAPSCLLLMFHSVIFEMPRRVERLTVNQYRFMGRPYRHRLSWRPLSFLASASAWARRQPDRALSRRSSRLQARSSSPNQNDPSGGMLRPSLVWLCRGGRHEWITPGRRLFPAVSRNV
jgi:hypothetical protein